jgi:peptidoglycan/LPS O-acetylase OafA/YrhL
MEKDMSYKITLTFCAAVLVLISLRMHIDPAGITASEFPSAQGDAFDVAVTMRHLVASLLFVIASVTFFARSVEGEISQRLLLNGCILGFAVMGITLGTVTFTQLGNLMIGAIVFAVLTALCLLSRVKLNRSN